MARNIQTYVVGEDGKRDTGKHFFLKEMPASQGERWAMRALSAMARSNADIDTDMIGLGMAGLAAVGAKALLSMPWDELEPLMAEMFECIQIIPNPNAPAVMRPLIEDDIEEVVTRAKLRMEVLSLHLGFSIAAELSKLGAAAKARQATSQPTPTSHKRSAPPSPPGKRRSTS